MSLSRVPNARDSSPVNPAKENSLEPEPQSANNQLEPIVVNSQPIVPLTAKSRQTINLIREQTSNETDAARSFREPDWLRLIEVLSEWEE